ncbi:MAG: CPBP family intramembrane glutamic endopeptidase [Terracidiphilus sp.]|jgi:membrane protease YdiL (CAAX protease family)
MQGDEMAASGNSNQRQRPEQIASWGRLVGFLLIGVGVVAFGFLAQHAPAGGGGAAPGEFASHNKAIPIYLMAIFMDWALLYYCWAAVHHHDGNLRTLSGGRWTSWKSVVVDLGIALPFWLLWEGAAYGVHWLLDPRLLGSGSAKTVDSLLPQSLHEVLVWIAMCVTAGVCEEMVFRGFVQRQFHALSGSIVVAVLAQGVIFGLFHSYQGWRNVAVISVLGILYGALAAWRGNVRANIVVHAWTDVWEGWLKFLVWR